MRLIGIFARIIFLSYISALKHCSLKLLQTCKSYQPKSRFCGKFFLGILRYSRRKTEFDNLGPVIRA